MNLLLDTHAFLWWITDDNQLSKQVRELIRDGRNKIFWSTASSWEVAIKYALGRLPLPDFPEKFLPNALVENRIESLPINDFHAYRAGRLPLHHRDPFDRMLIAQAQAESLTLLSDDPQFSRYGLKVIW